MAKWKRYAVVNKTNNELTPSTQITYTQKRLYDFLRNYAYLNGEMAGSGEVNRFLGERHKAGFQSDMVALELAGLVIRDMDTNKWVLAGFTAGLCRVPFLGELHTGGVLQTTEKVCNFFDLVNTPYYNCYRVMRDFKYKDCKLGDYIIVSTDTTVPDESVVLFVVPETGLPNIGRYSTRTHGCLVLDHTTLLYKHYPTIQILGEVVGVIRLETPIDRVFTKSRIKVLGDTDNQSEVQLQ